MVACSVALIPRLICITFYPLWPLVPGKVLQNAVYGAVERNIEEGRSSDNRARCIDVEYSFGQAVYRQSVVNVPLSLEIPVGDVLMIRVCPIYPRLVWANPQRVGIGLYLFGVAFHVFFVFGLMALAWVFWHK